MPKGKIKCMKVEIECERENKGLRGEEGRRE